MISATKRMAVGALQDKAQQASPPYCYEPGKAGLDAVLGGIAEGVPVHIVGSGPSAEGFTKPKGKAMVVVVNAAYKQLPDADVWLTSEATIGALDAKTGKPRSPWFYEAQDFGGVVVWERYVAMRSGAELVAMYSKQFLEAVLWHHRFHWRPHCSIRNYGKYNLAPGGHKSDGLWYVQQNTLERSVNEEHTEPLGTVLSQAIHLAGIMGASEIHTHGFELYFPGGKQHAFDDSGVYQPGLGLTGVVAFKITDGEPVPHPKGNHKSTRFFIESSLAVRQVIRAAALEVEFVDHSGGLLNPTTVKPHKGADK